MTAPDLAARGRANRRQGHQHERDVVTYLRRWFPKVRRQLHAHNADIESTGPLSIECKYTTWQAIPAAVDQAAADAARRGLTRGVVIKKRQGIADIGQAFWIGTVEQEMAAAARLIELEARCTYLEGEVQRAYERGVAAHVEAHRAAPPSRPANRRPPPKVTPAGERQAQLRRETFGPPPATPAPPTVPSQAPVVMFKPPGTDRAAHPEGLPF